MSQGERGRQHCPLRPRGSAPRNLRKDVHVAVGTDLLKQRILIDLPVDGNGRARLEVRQECGELFAEPREKLAHICGLNLEFAHAAGELAQVADQGHMGHGCPRSRWVRPTWLSTVDGARTRGGSARGSWMEANDPASAHPAPRGDDQERPEPSLHPGQGSGPIARRRFLAAPSPTRCPKGPMTWTSSMHCRG